MPELARTFQVTTRTIQNDVAALTVDYPPETQQGNGGPDSGSRQDALRGQCGLYADKESLPESDAPLDD